MGYEINSYLVLLSDANESKQRDCAFKLDMVEK